MVVTASPEVLLTILVLLIIGIFVILVWLVNYIAGPSVKKESKGKRPSVQFAVEPSEELSEPWPTAGDVTERRSLPMGGREIMRVLRDEDTGTIIVEVEGNRYRRLTEIRDGRIGNQVLETIADLIKFTGGIVRGQWATKSVLTSASTGERPSQPRVVEPASPPQAVEPPGSDEEAFLRRLREGDLQFGKTPAREARPGPMGFFRRRKPPVAAEGTGTGGTFIDEIEEILQRMISTAPIPLGKEVHVRTGPDGGLQIQVGGQYFSRSDEVSDPAVRDLIKAAVKEWEGS
ncbi:MAG: hypothetical protein ACETWR_15905 [Anaerolineae bacterium]